MFYSEGQTYVRLTRDANGFVFAESIFPIINLLKQGYIMEHLNSSFKKLYGRQGDLIKQNEVSL